MGRFKSHNRLLAALVLACRNATCNQKKKYKDHFCFYSMSSMWCSCSTRTLFSWGEEVRILSHYFLFHEFKVYCDMARGGWTLIARFSNADSNYWMQNSGSWWYDRKQLMAVLPVHLTTMTWYHLHFGSFKAIISKFLEVMTVLIQDYSKLIAVPVGERLEALLPASVTSDIAPPGTATHVVEVVI